MTYDDDFDTDLMYAAEDDAYDLLRMEQDREESQAFYEREAERYAVMTEAEWDAEVEYRERADEDAAWRAGCG